jgi:hypothetical protein
MVRRLFTVLSALSLLLCLTAGGLWARSYWWYDQGHVVVGRTRVSVQSGNGNLALVWHAADPAAPPRKWETGPGEGAYRGREYDPFRASYASRRHTGLHRDVLEVGRVSSVPIQSLVLWWGWVCLALASLPVSRLVSRCVFERRRRIKQGLCPSCGYDLRATPGRCPECGETGAVSGVKA